MQTVSVRQTVDAPAAAVREAMADREAFMRAGGFDEVTVDGDRIHLANSVGLLTIDLDLEVTEATDRTMTYEQVDGIFESMTTRFTIEEGGTTATGGEGQGGDGDRDDDGDGSLGVTVLGETTFALDANLVGPILDATVIKRQRRKELAGHFDYLEARAATVAGDGATDEATPES